MDLAVAWLLFPAVFLLIAFGMGLLVERCAGVRISGVLLVPLGVAAVVVVSQLTTVFDATAELTTPLVVALALAGLAVGAGRLKRPPVDWWALAGAGAVFCVFAAPVVLSGEATFAGYTILGDISVYLLGVDWLMEGGREVSGLAPSAYEFTLEQYYGSAGYPSGAMTALGAVRPLVDQDAAWVFQPYLTVLAVATTLALYELVSSLVSSRPLRALVAGVAGQSTLVLAYALQGSIKEICSVWAVATLGAVLPLWPKYGTVRAAIPLAIVSAAGLGIIGIAIAPWLGPLLLGSLLLALQARVSIRRMAVAAGGFIVLVLVLALPVFTGVSEYVRVVPGVVTGQQEMGNLLRPLENIQVFGIWLTGDYRVEPLGREAETHLLISVAALGVLIGVAWALKRRAWPLIIFLVASLVAWWYVTRRGSPWADGKALAIFSPAVLLSAMLGAIALWSWRRWAGAALALPVIAGVVWSNALAYHDVSLAPRDRHGELSELGERLAGEGPTLYFEGDEFIKHYLRDAKPEGPNEPWQRRHAEAVEGDPGAARQGFSSDADQFAPSYIDYYKTIVLRRSPGRSRPPAIYRREWQGEFYEVWVRPDEFRGGVIEHMPLGDNRTKPDARPRCRDIRPMAARARAERGRLAFAQRRLTVAVLPTETAFPRTWNIDVADGRALVPNGPGVVADSVRVTEAGRYELWVEGSFGRGYEVWVDARRVGELRKHLNVRGQANYVATVDLEPGTRVIELRRGGGDISPGSGGRHRLLGPMMLVRQDGPADSVKALPASRWRELCGRTLDWVEVVRADVAPDVTSTRSQVGATLAKP